MPTAIKESQDYIALATSLSLDFAQNAVERDKQGVTAKFERDRLRRSGLLKLIIPQEYGGLRATWITTLVLLGIALGAFSQAKEYTTSQTKLWQTSDIESKSTDRHRSRIRF